MSAAGEGEVDWAHWDAVNAYAYCAKLDTPVQDALHPFQPLASGVRYRDRRAVARALLPPPTAGAAEARGEP